MNSGSEKKLSMDELMAMNRSAQTKANPVSTPPGLPPTEFHCPMPEAVEQLAGRLENLENLSSWQTEYLRLLCETRGKHPTRTQMDELLKQLANLEQIIEQAGKLKEKSFPLPSIRLPRLYLPYLDGPTWVTLLMALAVLLLLWWRSGGVWSNLSRLLQ